MGGNLSGWSLDGCPAAPQEVVYGPFVLEYGIDMQPNESSLDLQGVSDCQQKYWLSA